MLPRADLSTTAVSRVDGAAAVGKAVEARQQELGRALSGSLGKVLQADILSKFTDGSFLVKVAGFNARMRLPDASQVGRQVALTLVAIDPRPAFEIASQPGLQTFADPTAEAPPERARAAPPDNPAGARVGSGAHAAALLARSALLPAAQLGALGAATPAPTLTETAKVLGQVMAAVQQAGPAPSALVGRAPLLAGAPGAPAQLAAALQETLSTSGLFYESHVAEWAGGQRPRADLVQEPQMQRATQLAPAGEGARAGSPAENATAQLVNLQLHTQEQARVAWQGQPWPGQDLRWDVAREGPGAERGGQPDETEAGWRSNVTLRFALLGEINARVVLRGEHLHIQIDAAGAVGALLREHAGALGLSLDAAGTPLASLAIRSAEPA